MSLSPPEPSPASPRSTSSDFWIGDRLVQPQLNRIVTPTATIQLEPKIMKVLLCLAERPANVVSKETLFREVWEGAYVTEDVLTRAIGELRRAFDDDASRPRVIETIRKAGYRILVRPEPETPVRPAATTSRPVRRIVQAFLVALIAAAAIFAVSRQWKSVRLEIEDRLPMRMRPLTSLPGNQRDPALSPDGTRVAFVWDGARGHDFSLYVQLIDSETPLRLTQEPGAEDRAPAWSPDGRRLAFTRAKGSDCRILIVDSLGGRQRPVGPCADADYRRLAWSPDGAWIALSSRTAAHSLSIELLSPETLQHKTVTQPPAGTLGDTSPTFSADGRLAFVRNITDGVGDIYVSRSDGGEPVRLTYDNRDIVGLDWSEDGRHVLFSSSRAGIYSLWRVSVDGGEPTFVAGGGAKMKHPSAARARNAIAYESWLYELNLWRVDMVGSGPPQPLTRTSDQWNFEPSVSPDGSRVAFVSTRSGEQEIWTAETDGSLPRRVTSFQGARLETPRWSPDGRRIVFSARREAQADLWSIDADGGVAQRVTSGPGDSVAPAWSHDGAMIDFASRRSGHWEVWKLSLSDRQAYQVTDDGGYGSQESADGQWLYFTRPDVAGLWRQPVGATGPASRILDSLAPENWDDWRVGREGIYFARASADGRPSVAFLPFGAKTPARLFSLPDLGWSGFSVSENHGGFLVYSRVDRQSCEIRLIDNPR